MLEQFHRARLRGALPMVAALHGLHLTFQAQDGPLAIARNAGISVLDRMPRIKSMITQYAMGLS